MYKATRFLHLFYFFFFLIKSTLFTHKNIPADVDLSLICQVENRFGNKLFERNLILQHFCWFEDLVWGMKKFAPGQEMLIESKHNKIYVLTS